jgi:hypothetical protein
MYYSNSALNWGDPNHQHFSLMENPQTPNTYYIGFEENLGLNATEGYGDYNDVIFKLQTTQNQTFNLAQDVAPLTVTPEPSTWSIMGLGLAGLVVVRRFKSRRVP